MNPFFLFLINHWKIRWKTYETLRFFWLINLILTLVTYIIFVLFIIFITFITLLMINIITSIFNYYIITLRIKSFYCYNLCFLKNIFDRKDLSHLKLLFKFTTNYSKTIILLLNSLIFSNYYIYSLFFVLIFIKIKLFTNTNLFIIMFIIFHLKFYIFNIIITI
jgi:hypothetical protein